MRDILLLFRKEFVCSYIEAPVYLHGVTIDDFSVEDFRDMDSRNTLARAGRAKNDEQVFSLRFQFLSRARRRR